MVFKAYDIRGRYPEEINEELFTKIGKSILNLGDIKTIVVGRDMRLSSPQLKKALVEGLQDSGINVVDIGLASTPMLYHATYKMDVDMGIIITASHNPSYDNGMKLCWSNAIPIAWDSGIEILKKCVEKNDFKNKGKKGNYEKYDFREDYSIDIKHYGEKNKELSVVIDAGNGMGGYVDSKIVENFVTTKQLYCELDGNFPNHEANPIKEETLVDLQKTVMTSNADIGFAIDGDADRVGVVDEKGNTISADLLAAFLITYYVEKFPEENIYSYDLRSSKIVEEIIKKAEKTPFQTRVGHSFIKKAMREHGSFFSSELSGHYYFWFEDSVVYDSALRTILEVIKAVSYQKKPLSECIEEFRVYSKSPETNFSVNNKEKVFSMLKQEYSDADIEEIDGVTFSYEHFWFNVRASNTENILRVNFEANNDEIYQKEFSKLSVFINQLSDE